MAKSFDWENPWRPNIEAKMAMAWGMAATATLIIGKYMPVPIPLKFSAMAALVCTGKGAVMSCLSIRFVGTKKIEGMSYRIFGFIPKAKPGAKPKVQLKLS